MSYFNMVCDSCGREVQGITWVNGMKFCAKCYQEIFGNKNMTENLKNMYEAYLKILNKQAQRIAELEEQLANSIRPKFPRQEHICGFAFGEIREYIVVAYLDNDITLCENIETSELEWCDNKFLVGTFEEAQAKLKELQGEKK